MCSGQTERVGFLIEHGPDKTDKTHFLYEFVFVTSITKPGTERSTAPIFSFLIYVYSKFQKCQAFFLSAVASF